MQFKFMTRKRPRVSAAILRNGGSEVLMVCHARKDGSTYWQLPGGGLHHGEKAEAGALRELLEETGLHGRVVRWLFSIPYKYGSSTTFLVEIEDGAEAQLGSDPEEVERGFRKLIDVAWQPVSEMEESPEVRMMGIVLSYLDKLPVVS
jgi:8-oxo-dGTP pyrophosphatase MutT (NUDIX family)